MPRSGMLTGKFHILRSRRGKEADSLKLLSHPPSYVGGYKRLPFPATCGFLHLMTRLCLIVLNCFLACFAPTAFGEVKVLNPTQVAAEYDQRVWRKEDGLPDNRVQAIRQTKDGYLWIATKTGLARFDGTRFTVFNHINTPAMVNDDWSVLSVDSDDNLWIGGARGLMRYSRGQFTSYAHEDGICGPTNAPSVVAICSGRQNVVWIGTKYGLSRFQNGKFDCFNKEHGLEELSVDAVGEDAAGVLWIGTHYGGLQNRNPLTGAFSPSIKAPQGANLGGMLVSDGVLTNTYGLFWWKSVVGSFVGRLAELKGDRWELVSDQLTLPNLELFLEHDRAGNIWLRTLFPQPSVVKFDKSQLTYYPVPTVSAAIGPNVVLSFHEDREGSLWIGTDLGGLCRWTPRKIATYSVRDGLANDNSWTICEGRDGSVWVGTDGGVSRIKDGKITNLSVQDGLPRREVRTVVEDQDGTLWVGTLNGLSSIKDGKIMQHRFPGEWYETKIRVLFSASDGALWVGTVAGLSRLQNDQLTKYSVNNGLARSEVLALHEDRTGNLWIGTAGGGLQRFGVPPSGGSVNHNGNDSENAPDRLKPGLRTFTTFTTTNGLSNNFVWAFHEDTDGVLWIGTESGLNRYENGRFTAFTTREGLPADLVNEVLEDDFGNLWVSHDNGIYRVRKNDLNDVAAGRAKAVQAVSYDESDGLPINETNGQKSQPAGCKTRDGRLWFPTPKGVAIIDPKLCGLNEVAPHAVIEQIRADGELIFDNSAAPATAPLFESRSSGRESAPSKIPDAQSLLTPAATVQGTQVGNDWSKSPYKSERPLSPARTGAENSPKLVEPRNERSAAVPSRSTAPRGLTQEFSRTSPIGPAAAEASRAPVHGEGGRGPGDGKAQGSKARTGVEKPQSLNEKPALSRARLRLPPGSGRVLEFRYTAPVFTAPEKAAFRYRLRGAGDNWIEAGTRREAYFTKLPPGNYDFEVVAANHRGVWGEKSANFAFYIQPFYYQTWWFYLTCGLATAGLIAGVVVWRIRELRKLHRLERQAAIVDERTRIAKDLHDGLGADLTRLTMLADLASGEPGGGEGEHLKKLSRSSREAARELKEMIWVANPANDTVEGLVSRICQSAEDFLHDARVRCRLDIAPRLPEHPLSVDQRRNLLLVVREAINNIVKHARATEVHVRASGSSNTLHLEIEDNGRGFDPGAARPDGLGLGSMKRRVENMGGTFELASHQGTGTKIVITIKLSQSQ